MASGVSKGPGSTKSRTLVIIQHQLFTIRSKAQGAVIHLFFCDRCNKYSAVTLEHAALAFLTKIGNCKLYKTIIKINKGNKCDFGEYMPEGVAKKELQYKRDE